MEIVELRSRIEPTLRRAGVRRASLFGSATKKASPNDVDILVDLDSRMSLLGFLKLKHELEQGLGQRVDLVEYSTIKPSLKQSIQETEVRLF